MKLTEEQIKNRELNLDVIIPQYKETEEIIRPLLESIDFQAGVSFNKIGVIIVNDKSDVKLSDEFLKTFKNLHIRYIETPENKGPGQARQYGLDKSDAEYVTFADSDDRFLSCNVFIEVFNALLQHKDKNIDILFTKWIEELPTPDGRYLQIAHGKDQTWCHGKFFRREFLTSKNLRFNENIRVHEDSYFNTLVQMNAEVTADVDVFSYYWCYNSNSLTRNPKYKYNYLVETADDLIRSTSDLMKELTQRKTEHRNEYFIKAILFMYFLLQAPYWNEKINEDQDLYLRRRKFEYSMLKLMQEYSNVFEETPRAVFLQYKNDERAQCCLNTGFEDELETWEQFINRLNTSYPAYTKTCRECKYYVEGEYCKFNSNCIMSLNDDYGIYTIPSHFEDANTPEIDLSKYDTDKSVDESKEDAEETKKEE